MKRSLEKFFVTAAALAAVCVWPAAAQQQQAPGQHGTAPKTPDNQLKPRQIPDRLLEDLKKSPAPKQRTITEKDVPRAKPKTPLEAALRDGFPANAVKRALVRDNLYALLATAPDKKTANRISSALERIYLTSGSSTVDLLMERGIKAANAKKYAQAMKYLDAVTELAPDYAEGWNRRAFVLYRQNDYHRAAGDLRRVLALDPNHIKALDGLGTILQATGDEAGALKVFNRLSDVNPYWPGTERVLKELKRKVEGRGI